MHFACRCGLPDFSNAVNTNTTSPFGNILLSNVTYEVPADDEALLCSGPKTEGIQWWLNPLDNSTTAMNFDVPSTGHVCKDGNFCVAFENPASGTVNFDNALWAFQQIFQILTNTNWVTIMYYAMDAVSEAVPPLFIMMVIFGSFFLLNLALAVLYLQFSKDKADNEERRGDTGPLDGLDIPAQAVDGDGLDADERKDKLIAGVQMAFMDNPNTRGIKKTWLGFRGSCYKLSESSRFDLFCMFIILANSVMMALQW